MVRAADDSRITEEIIIALGRIGEPSSEPDLIELLAADDPRAQVAAARALGLLGTTAAVEPLLGMTSGLASRALRQAARTAIASIQERLVGAEAGQVSMAAATGLEGALSRDQGQLGALSLDTGEPA